MHVVELRAYEASAVVGRYTGFERSFDRTKYLLETQQVTRVIELGDNGFYNALLVLPTYTVACLETMSLPSKR